MIDPNNFILHFGCRDKAGHYLTQPNGQSVRDFEADNANVPRAHEYDGSTAFLPFPEKPGHGCLTYLPANNRTILAWWDRTFDDRGGCNMALIVNGQATALQIWERMKQNFPDLRDKLTMPACKGCGQ